MNKNPLELFYDKGCSLCGVLCKTDRKNSNGPCNAGDSISIASAVIHHGEEPPISGTDGSGTVFLSNCSLKCAYCQNYPISQNNVGRKITENNLAETMLNLQKKKAHNINFVTPTHYSKHIYDSVVIARNAGLNIPVVWNTSSYENPATIPHINEITDIYLADIRYAEDSEALRLSNAKNYREIVFGNVKYFYKSKSNLKTNKQGIAQKGVIIRVLLLPGMKESAKKILDFIAAEIDRNAFVSIMSQYVPYYKAHDDCNLKRKLNIDEYEDVLEYAEKLRLDNAFIQEILLTEE